jgi:hypothetical protein
VEPVASAATVNAVITKGCLIFFPGGSDDLSCMFAADVVSTRIEHMT